MSGKDLSAANPKIAGKFLQNDKDAIKRGQLLSDIYHNQTRHTDVRQRWKDRDKYLTPGKVKPKPRPFSEELAEPKSQLKQEIKESIGMILPRNFCPDCGEVDKPHSRGVININRYDADRPDLHIKADSLLISFFCQGCVEKQVQKQQSYDPADDIQIVMPGGGTISQKQIKSAERLVKIKRQTEDFIKARILADDKSIFPQGDPYE
jgi:hypothetical protein